MNNKVFVSCAVTGSGDTAKKHPDLPKTPEQIAKAAIEAAKAGAAAAGAAPPGSASAAGSLSAAAAASAAASGDGATLNAQGGMRRATAAAEMLGAGSNKSYHIRLRWPQ